MANVFPRIDEAIRAFVEAQPMFFVGSAPSGGDGLVNISPKGYRDSFAVVDDHTVAYLDLFGSGAETIAHVKENGRIVVMFCSFERNSRIVRFHGRGTVLRPDCARFTELAPLFNLQHPGLRSIIEIEVARVSDSCGYTIPYMELVDERPVLDKVHGKRTPEEWAVRVAGVNARSLDGLPALDPDHPLPTSVPRPAPAPEPTATALRTGNGSA